MKKIFRKTSSLPFFFRRPIPSRIGIITTSLTIIYHIVVEIEIGVFVVFEKVDVADIRNVIIVDGYMRTNIIVVCNK
ncbi:hypothetical protein MtrunA17_Chr3g0110981 [Medicago truncatula]|uniref:Transmembrane protein n=1 Tax=Medicago truncatula TaxID=3880 RepID=A0A396IUX5_MEDTR|nr:hypothetical protein MtrunA17_Chr3g0110981 [Medicago truncatula]